MPSRTRTQHRCIVEGHGTPNLGPFFSSMDYFEDALFTVFAHHQPARGDPGTRSVFADEALAPSRHGERRIVYRIPELSSENTRLFAHHQWDAGVHLAKMITTREMDVRAKRVVELGAGTGLPSLVAAVMGARHCVVTDYPDPDILAALQRNVHDTCDAYTALSLEVRGLAWGDVTQEAQAGGPFDMVMAADVLWVSSQHAHLLHSICALLAHTSEARAVIVAGFHTGRPATARFFEAAREAGLVPDAMAKFGGMYERSVLGDERAYTASDDMGDIEERSKWVVVACLRWR